MSKRYVIQVATSDLGWTNVQHPSGGDWMTRSRSTAIADAAKLVNAGETRELRVGVSKPVYAITADVNFEAILEAAKELKTSDWLAEGDTDDETDSDYDDDDDDDDDDVAPIQFELVEEAPVLKTDNTDPDAPQII